MARVCQIKIFSELDELKYFISMFNFTPALNKTSLFSMGHCNYIKKK